MHNPQPANQPTSWVLVAISPELNGLAFELDTNLRIGRSQRNDIIIDHPSISRIHAKINRIGSKIFIQDLESAHGTYINGKRLGKETIRIKTNDELTFGNLLFIVQDDEHDRIIMPTSTETTDDIEVVEVEIEDIDNPIKQPTQIETENYLYTHADPFQLDNQFINNYPENYTNVMLSNTIDLSAIAEKNEQPITTNINLQKPKKNPEKYHYPNNITYQTMGVSATAEKVNIKKLPFFFMLGGAILIATLIVLVFLL